MMIVRYGLKLDMCCRGSLLIPTPIDTSVHSLPSESFSDQYYMFNKSINIWRMYKHNKMTECISRITLMMLSRHKRHTNTNHENTTNSTQNIYEASLITSFQLSKLGIKSETGPRCALDSTPPLVVNARLNRWDKRQTVHRWVVLWWCQNLGFKTSAKPQTPFAFPGRRAYWVVQWLAA